MITLNRDPIKFEFSIGVVVGLVAIAGTLVFLARRRIHGTSIFVNFYESFLGNLALHIFILTGIYFLGFLFLSSIVQIMVISFHAAIFEPSCVLPSQRDTALFVWDAMAHGVFKIFAKYLNISHDGCLPDAKSWTSWITSLVFTGFTSIVLLWYAISFVKGYFAKARGS
jgi:hypothetical protein